jgi:hypothetical protein
VRVRASHHVHVRLPRLVQVVRVAAFAAEEGRVFGAADGFADAVLPVGRGVVSNVHRVIIANGAFTER